ncbi:MAG: hypothetical protein U0575_06430 [Phycisphaerales bacterium]
MQEVDPGRWPRTCRAACASTSSTTSRLDALRGFSPRDLEHAGRLVEPLVAGPLDLNYRRTGWDHALDRVADEAPRTIDGPSSASSTCATAEARTEAAFLHELFARVYGTNHVNSGAAPTTATGRAAWRRERLHRLEHRNRDARRRRARRPALRDRRRPRRTIRGFSRRS